MPAMPLGSLFFGGYGDSGSFRFYSPTGTNLGQPPANPSFGTTGALNGLAVTSSGLIFFPGYPSWNPSGPGFYSANFASTISAGSYGAGQTRGGSSDGLGNAYYLESYLIASTRYSRVIKVTSSGVKTTVVNNILLVPYDILGNVSSFRAIGVSRDGATAYLLDDVRTVGSLSTVLKCNLTLGTYATFLTMADSGTAGFRGDGILVMPDDSVILPWGKLTTAGYPTRYNGSGAVLTTYNSLPGMGGSGRDVTVWLTFDRTSGSIAVDKFFAAYYSSASTSSQVNVTRVVLATGASLSTFQPSDGTFEFDAPFDTLLLAISGGGDGPGGTDPGGIIPDASTDCCATKSTPAGRAEGNIMEQFGIGWTAYLIGGGTVETATDLTDSENWATA